MPPAQRRRVYRLTYTTNTLYEDPKAARDRDGMAFDEINAALPVPDFAYETTIILYPNDKRRLDEGYPKFVSSDAIVLTIRPPLDDEIRPSPNDESKPGTRRFIPWNNGPLEKEIFDLCRKYFHHCDRRTVELTDKAKALLRIPENVLRKAWWNLEFYENAQSEGKTPVDRRTAERRLFAAVKLHNLSRYISEQPETNRETVAYLIRDQLPNIGCDVLVSFGMDGYCTLVWNHLVRRRYPDLIKKNGFVMARLVFEELPATTLYTPITIASVDKSVSRVDILAYAGPIA
jgi:hypothetical protein